MAYLKYVFIYFLITCSNVKQKGEDVNQCTQSVKFVNLIKEVIDMPTLQPYFHKQTYIDQKQLVILKNYQFKNSIKISKFGLPVVFLRENEITSKRIKAFIKFEKIQIVGDSANVYFRYNIEGIGCKAKYYLIDCNWKLKNVVLWEN
ncbi:MAG: hypothetical protein PHV20_02195 [Bacteroidales bacterium]|nr:hypothetical protein [Bacteroidales bacterium]